VSRYIYISEEYYGSEGVRREAKFTCGIWLASEIRVMEANTFNNLPTIFLDIRK
jgi:hypothetical protein